MSPLVSINTTSQETRVTSASFAAPHPQIAETAWTTLPHAETAPFHNVVLNTFSAQSYAKINPVKLDRVNGAPFKNHYIILKQKKQSVAERDTDKKSSI
ncbi:MAG: hypothetical protein P8M30_02790 [Planctomycetaceae bacterium]|jgi:hypothetical protein|nr:hypothetical protein [bacterium]MDG2388225.1 hypothetical protein [Planctomycetaceae bacterium]